MKEHFYKRLFHDWFNYEDVYREAIQSAPYGSTLVELGVHEGASLAFLAVEARNADKGLKLWGVDIFEDLDKLVRVRSWIEREKLDDIVNLIPGINSWEAAKDFEDRSLQFVWVDAEHAEEQCSKDITAFFPKLAPGGWMAGHDYDQQSVFDATAKFFGSRGIAIVPCSQHSWRML